MTNQSHAVAQQPGCRGKPIQVDVYAEQTPQGWVHFWHKWKFEGGPSQGKGRIELPKGAPETAIHFHLHDDTNLRLKFMENSDDCMWVSTRKCPQKKMNEGGQITFPNQKSESDRLIVHDANEGSECILTYTLRFDGHAGRQASDPDRVCPPYDYDPEIKNGGGNKL